MPAGNTSMRCAGSGSPRQMPAHSRVVRYRDRTVTSRGWTGRVLAAKDIEMISRRTLLQSSVAASAAILARARLAAAQTPQGGHAGHAGTKVAAPVGPMKLTKGR